VLFVVVVQAEIIRSEESLDMEIRSFTVPANRKAVIEEQFIKLNKRASKLGLDNITWMWGKARVEKRSVLYQNPEYQDLPPVFVERDIMVLPIAIAGPLEVKFDGWEFIATLQHLATGENVIRPISNEIEIPTQYRDSGSACEHCNINRYRKDTYLLHHHDNGIKQVGSTCIKDFLGGNSPEHIVNKANFISEVLSFMDGMEKYNVSGEYGYYINDFLATTVACINKFGWLSKSKAEMDGGKPTANIVIDNLNPPRNAPFKSINISDDDIKMAKLAAEWCENLSDDDVAPSDYLHNIRAIVRSGMVDNKTAGYAASIIAAYKRSVQEKETKNTTSGYVGVIKHRDVFNLTVKRYNVFDGNYGYSHQYIFDDQDGNVFCWYATSKQDLEIGNTYNIKGTIKKHSEYNGVKQTTITRCTLVK
jgi:hypothetical protein